MRPEYSFKEPEVIGVLLPKAVVTALAETHKRLLKEKSKKSIRKEYAEQLFNKHIVRMGIRHYLQRYKKDMTRKNRETLKLWDEIFRHGELKYEEPDIEQYEKEHMIACTEEDIEGR